MKTSSILLFSIFHCLLISCFAQTVEYSDNLLNLPLYYSESNPEGAITIFSLGMPFFFSSENPDLSQISIAYSMGNNWHPQARFLYPKNITQAQKIEILAINIEDREDFFRAENIATNEKMFQSDGIIQHLKFSFIRNWTRKNSLILNINIHQLVGGKSWPMYFISDRFIEGYHSLFNLNDVYGRKLFPYNKAFIQFDDEQGNSFRKNENDVFLSVFEGHFYKVLFHKKNQKWRFDAQGGIHLSVPMNNLHPYIIPGISVGVRTDLKSGKRTSFTGAFDLGVADQSFLKIGRGVQVINWKYRKQIKGLFRINKLINEKSIFVAGVIVNFQDPVLKGFLLNGKQSGYNEMGVSYLKEGDLWEGEAVSRRFYSAQTTLDALHYFSINTYFIVGIHKNGKEFNFYCGEDLFYINNAPDIQLSIQYRFSPFKTQWNK